MNDEELMLHLKGGEALAFDELYERYHKRLFGFFVKMLGFDREKAKDALQDLFLKIIEKPQLFDQSRSFRTWVFAVACNQCRNYYRSFETKGRAEEALLADAEETDEHFFARAAEKIDRIKFMDALNACLAEAEPEKRMVFLLRYQEEKSTEEVAAILEIPAGTVKSRLHNITKQLAEKLQLYKPVN